MTRGPKPPDRPTPEARRRVLRAALLRPWALLVLAVGIAFFAATLTWWALPLTLATYAALVALAVRDPVYRTLVLEGRERARAVARDRIRQVGFPLETRVGRLSRGENRDKIEAALEARRRVLVAVQGSDEATQRLFSRTTTKLNRVAELLVDLAEDRESTPASDAQRTSAIDAEISDAPEEFHALRAEVVRASIESDDEARTRAERVEKALDETEQRLRNLKNNG